MTIEKIISGGQTGADQGALRAAKSLRLKTGGYMPHGWRTETGPMPQFWSIYNMSEHTSAEYAPRTQLNVASSDGTLICGDFNSPGSKLTQRYCGELQKTFWLLYFKQPIDLKEDAIINFQQWLLYNKIKTLNVAGNRESKMPGIEQTVYEFLRKALKS